MNKTASLTPELLHIIENKGTEAQFSGEYCDPKPCGTYLCRRCGYALFRAHDQFHSGCGWPSFNLEIPSHVKRIQDKDGRRTEILCTRCDAHLGHVFEGEQFTAHNMRHCVNSLSLDFIDDETILDTEEIILAAGCFWGVEYYLKRLPGVLKTEVGYTGGHIDHPNYEAVCRKNTGHVEAIRILFDPLKISDTDVLKYFFEIHDATQTNGQGPDLGPQYLSAIFYYTPAQKAHSEHVMAKLKEKGYTISTTLQPVTPFWPAEVYHQNYYEKNGQAPYCHKYSPLF